MACTKNEESRWSSYIFDKDFNGIDRRKMARAKCSGRRSVLCDLGLND